MACMWESALLFEPTTTVSLLVQNVQQTLLQGIKWCFVLLLLCRFIRLRLGWLPRFFNTCLLLLYRFSSYALLWFLLLCFDSSILSITGWHGCSSVMAIVSPSVVTVDSTPIAVCRGSSVSFLAPFASCSSSLMVMGVVRPTASCC
mgnify:CR=1 FL=1